MQLTSDALAILATFVAAQTGALVFFAGVVTVTLRNHETRLTKTEEQSQSNLLSLTTIASREGIDL